MGTGTPVNEKEIITADKMNLKLERIAETPQRLEASRAYTTVYQNTSPDRTLHININFNVTITAAGLGKATLYLGPTNTPSTIAGSFGYGTNTAGTKTINGSIIALIPPLYYYKLLDASLGAGTITFPYWWETLL